VVLRQREHVAGGGSRDERDAPCQIDHYVVPPKPPCCWWESRWKSLGWALTRHTDVTSGFAHVLFTSSPGRTLKGARVATTTVRNDSSKN
jgi:hypothetical protein